MQIDPLVAFGKLESTDFRKCEHNLFEDQGIRSLLNAELADKVQKCHSVTDPDNHQLDSERGYQKFFDIVFFISNHKLS